MWPLEFEESPLVDNEDRIQPTILKWRSQGAEFCKRVNKSEKRKHYCYLPKPEGIIKHCKCTFFLIEKPR